MQHQTAFLAVLGEVDCLGCAPEQGMRHWTRASAAWSWCGAHRFGMPCPRTSAKRNSEGRTSDECAGRVADRQGRLAGSAGLVRVAGLITTTSHGDVQELSPTPPLP